MDMLLASGRTVTLTEKHVERFHRSYIITDTGCWEWTESKDPHGYGQFRARINGFRNQLLAHRVSLLFAGEELDPAKVVDHRECDNPPCVNPAHLLQVTHRENNLRGNSMAARWAARATCDEGHEFNITPRGQRQCYTCLRETRRQKRAA